MYWVRKYKSPTVKKIEYIAIKAAQGSKKFLKKLRSHFPDSFIFYTSNIGLLVFWNNHVRPFETMPIKLQQIASYIEVFGPPARIYKDKENLTAGRFQNRLSLKFIRNEIVAWDVMAL